ncbi:hypothetical protein BH11PSE3_BH11PSE3_06770 [soil metagenome]
MRIAFALVVPALVVGLAASADRDKDRSRGYGHRRASPMAMTDRMAADIISDLTDLDLD